jgi:hypothetical protein
MPKTNAATKIAPQKTAVRAKTLSPRDRQLAAQAEVARKAEEKRLAHNARVREYLKRKRAEKRAERALAPTPPAAAPAAPPAQPLPAAEPIAGLTKAELVAMLSAQIKLTGAQRGPTSAASERIAALRVALELAKHLA